jgi:hypothetical protein
MPRSIPQHVSELKVPNLNYDYFLDHRSRPFSPIDGRFCPLTAWWLMECALLSYIGDQRSVGRHLTNAGFESVTFCEANKLRAIIADKGADTFVIFRGTLFNELANVLTDLAMKRHRWSGGGRVHTGFHEGFLALLPHVKTSIDNRRGQRIWFSGHSLGGALATLFAAHFPGPTPLYTFGSPRVGDADFRTAFVGQTHRVVLGRDIIATLPPKPLYRHLTPSHRLNAEGRITASNHDKHRTAKDLISGVREVARHPRDVARYLLTNNVIADHAPILYSVGLWHAVEQMQS